MATHDLEQPCLFDQPIYLESEANRIANLAAHFDIHSLRGRRLLETGCGIGRLGDAFEAVGCHVVSVDAREKFIQGLRARRPGREAVVMDLDRWDPATLGRFDAILCFGMLNALAAPESFLIKCAQTADLIFLDAYVVDLPWSQCLFESEPWPDGAYSGIGCRPSSAWIVNLLERQGFLAQDISSPVANWGGEFPGVFDWQPRHDGQWRHGNTFLRKMWVCRRVKEPGSRLVYMHQPTEWSESEIAPLVLGTLGRADLSGTRILMAGDSSGGASDALSSAGARVHPLSWLDDECHAAARAFDVAVLQGASAPVLRRVLRVAPILVLELVPRSMEAEEMLRILDGAGYYLSQQRVHEAGIGARTSLLAFRLRENTGVALRPLLVHVHIHKCGGTSLNRLLEMSFGNRHFNHYPMEQGPLPTREDLVELVLARPEMLSLSSHSIRIFPTVIGDRLPIYITFLREPVARFISLLTYFKKNYATSTDGLKQNWPTTCPSLSVREMAAWMMDSQPEPVRSGALMTQFLSEQTWLDTLGGVLNLSDRWLDRGSLVYRGFEPLRLALAASMLESFFFVGLIEEMDASVRVLRNRLLPQGLHLLDAPVPVENVSRELAVGIDWLNSGDSLGRRVLTFLDEDRALYARFREQLHSRLRDAQ